MENLTAVVFIGAAIVAITQEIKLLAPNVSGVVTIPVAAVVGLLIALIDVNIGLNNITIAQGIMTGLAAAGVHTTVSNSSARA